MVEFAIVLPILVILFFGFVEIGRALYQENLLTKAIVTGTRYVARVPDAVTDTCQPGPDWAAASTHGIDLVVHAGTGVVRLPGLDDAGAVSFSIQANSVGGETACVVQGQARAQFAAIFGESVVPLLKLGSIPLTANAEERFIGE